MKLADRLRGADTTSLHEAQEALAGAIEALAETTEALASIESTRSEPTDDRQRAAVAELRRVVALGNAALAAVDAALPPRDVSWHGVLGTDPRPLGAPHGPVALFTAGQIASLAALGVRVVGRDGGGQAVFNSRAHRAEERLRSLREALDHVRQALGGGE